MSLQKVEAVRQRLELLREAVVREEGRREERLREVQELSARVKALSDEEEILRQAELAITELAQKVLGSSTKNIDTLISGGLKAVFQDQSLEFKTVIDRYRGKTAMRPILMQNGHEAPIMEAYGGGVLVVVGVLLRVALIMALNLRKVLVLDETLSHVSEVYIPGVSALLRKLCKELGFEILLVTHADLFAEGADRHYHGKEGPDDTVVFELKKG